MLSLVNLTANLLLASAEENRESTDEEEGEEIQLEMVEMTLGTLDLRECEIHPSRHKRRRRRKKEEAKIPIEGRSDQLYHHRWNPRHASLLLNCSAKFMKYHIRLGQNQRA